MELRDAGEGFTGEEPGTLSMPPRDTEWEQRGMGEKFWEDVHDPDKENRSPHEEYQQERVKW